MPRVPAGLEKLERRVAARTALLGSNSSSVTTSRHVRGLLGKIPEKNVVSIATHPRWYRSQRIFENHLTREHIPSSARSTDDQREVARLDTVIEELVQEAATIPTAPSHVPASEVDARAYEISERVRIFIHLVLLEEGEILADLQAAHIPKYRGVRVDGDSEEWLRSHYAGFLEDSRLFQHVLGKYDPKLLETIKNKFKRETARSIGDLLPPKSALVTTQFELFQELGLDHGVAAIMSMHKRASRAG